MALAICNILTLDRHSLGTYRMKYFREDNAVYNSDIRNRASRLSPINNRTNTANAIKQIQVLLGFKERLSHL